MGEKKQMLLTKEFQIHMQIPPAGGRDFPNLLLLSPDIHLQCTGFCDLCSKKVEIFEQKTYQLYSGDTTNMALTK